MPSAPPRARARALSVLEQVALLWTGRRNGIHCDLYDDVSASLPGTGRDAYERAMAVLVERGYARETTAGLPANCRQYVLRARGRTARRALDMGALRQHVADP